MASSFTIFPEALFNIVPATMTLSEEMLLGICETAKAYQAEGRQENKARFQGINMEGPFVAPAKKGAQNGEYIHDPDEKNIVYQSDAIPFSFPSLQPCQSLRAKR